MSEFVGEMEYVSMRRAGKYPVRVYQTIGGNAREPYCVCPIAKGGVLNGCLAQGRTVDEAIDRLTAMLPSILKFHREGGSYPKPAPLPLLTLHDASYSSSAFRPGG